MLPAIFMFANGRVMAQFEREPHTSSPLGRIRSRHPFACGAVRPGL